MFQVRDDLGDLELTLPPHHRQLQALVVRFAQFSTEELLRYVYTRYVRDSTRLLDRAIPA